MTRNKWRRSDLYREGRREALKKAFPQISRLEQLTELENLSLVRVWEPEYPAKYLVVYYTAISKYHNVRKILIDKMVDNERNIKYCSRKPLINLERDGTTESEERYYDKLHNFSIHAKLDYPRSNLEINLKINNK